MIVGQVVLVHVRVGVLGSVVVRVRVLMLEVVVVVTGVRMRVSKVVVLVFVGVRSAVAVLIVRHLSTPCRAGKRMTSIVLCAIAQGGRVCACSPPRPGCRTVLMGLRSTRAAYLQVVMACA